MNPTNVVALYSTCLGGFLALAGVLSFQAGQPQAALALSAAAFCAFLATVVTALIVGRANAAQVKARANYAQRYGEGGGISLLHFGDEDAVRVRLYCLADLAGHLGGEQWVRPILDRCQPLGSECR